MGKRGSFRDGSWKSPEPELSVRGSILNPAGNVISTPGEFDFKEGEPRADETVYVLKETVRPQHNVGTTLGLQFILKPGWMLCTFQIPGGGDDDCGLVFLRGEAAPPDGTRFVLRMLRPEDEPRGDNGEETQSDSEGQTDDQAEAEPDTPDDQEKGSSNAALLARNPEARAVLDDDLDDYGPDGL